MPKGRWEPFTPAQEQFMRDNYLDLSLNEIGRRLGCSDRRVKRWLTRNGLEVPQALLDQRSKESLFHKGHETHNKGKRQEDYMSIEAIERSKSGRYKKGRKPHNTKYNGAVTIRREKGCRPVKWIRTAEAEWKPLHYHLWEQAYGDVEEGKILKFKNGDTLDCRLENLESVDRIAHMLRNSRHNYPEEIIEPMATLRKINKQIQKKEQNG